MQILHMLWLPFAYWFFPYKLANHALRGTLKHYGVNLEPISNELTQEISSRIIANQMAFDKKKSVFKKLNDLQMLVNHDAIVMKKIIKHEYQYEFEFTPEVEQIKNIMLKHAVRNF